MKEINLASVVIAKRKEKKITQDELANYLGVSKAAISKWETAQSYPDITLLPHIATFFNITIDELIGYSPQMDREEIKRTYHRLSAEFAKEEFDVVHEFYVLLCKINWNYVYYGVYSSRHQDSNII